MQEYYDSFIGMHIDELTNKLSQTSVIKLIEGEKNKTKKLVYDMASIDGGIFLEINYNIENGTIENINYIVK